MKKLILLSVLIFGFYFSYGQDVPAMRYEDKIRIREAIHISKLVGDKLWKGINEVPFVVLLVTDSVEFLINHPYPSNDFVLSEDDKILNTKILYRQKRFPDWYLATFPAVNGVNCIVVGTPEKTNKNSTNWIITLLHEHFHQYQFTSMNYYDEVNKLDLSGADETGMWQLNYAFPYDNVKTIQQFNKYTSALHKAVSNVERRSFKNDFRNYLRERTRFRKSLTPADYRYFSFQIWQEGIARYTEYKFIHELDNYIPTGEITQLKDFINFKDLKTRFYHAALNSITQSKLEIEKRICFYDIGFAEGILLDKLNPDWQKKYLTDRFYIENYFDRK
ncbi:hypothetical protein [Lacibacter sp.]|uniref:hypothetical protein n=1 Tax=Lacibacter sp. TaxID=1915409 RepID=UPI002B4AD8CC|nr:hypothetical protein [Lacibacter sp.]HLP37036.1 hypothetical protein [Lacibacter sp.]